MSDAKLRENSKKPFGKCLSCCKVVKSKIRKMGGKRTGIGGIKLEIRTDVVIVGTGVGGAFQP